RDRLGAGNQQDQPRCPLQRLVTFGCRGHKKRCCSQGPAARYPLWRPADFFQPVLYPLRGRVIERSLFELACQALGESLVSGALSAKLHRQLLRSKLSGEWPSYANAAGERAVLKGVG